MFRSPPQVRRYRMDSRGQRKTLLLIEDNHAIRNALRGWVSVMSPDTRLIEATSWAQGLFLSRYEPPDAVVVDISSLGTGGVEAVHRVSSAHPSAAIIALVADVHEAYRRAVRSAGAGTCASMWRARRELLPKLEEALSSGSEQTAGEDAV
jgi:DNA-binding NarL/FixJ family response regulator